MPPKKRGRPSKKLEQKTLFELGTRSSPPTHPRTRASTSKAQVLASPTKRKRNPVKNISIVSEDDDGSDLDAIKFQPKDSSNSLKPPLRSAKKRFKITAPGGDSERDVQSDEKDLDEEEVDVVQPAARRKGTGRQITIESNSEEASEPPPRKRKLIRGRKPALPSDDEDSIVDEVEPDRILTTRLRARDKKTAFQKNLEKLKRRKQGMPSELSSSDDEEEEESEDEDTPFKDAQPHSDRDSLFDEDSDETHSSDFIVEDDGTAAASLPTQFSMETHQDLAYHFKKIFQFFVHIAVRPPKERHDFMSQQIRDEEYFSVPLHVARRKISGLRDSLVASSVWRPEFRKPLEVYPEFELVPLTFSIPTCDACHLGGRTSTLIGRLGGFPYDRMGFEIMDDGDSDSDSEIDVNSDETPKNAEFHLGRFCAKRTKVFHDFTHWEFALFKCIRQEVDDLHASKQSRGFLRVAYAGGKKPPKDLGDADGICEWLDERKVIDMEWQKMRTMMDSARHLEIASKGGERD